MLHAKVSWDEFTKEQKSVELDELMKHFSHPTHIDPLAVSANWLDEGSRLVYASLSFTSLSETLKHYIPLDIVNGLSGGWNFFDGIAGNVSAIQQFRKLPDVQRRKKEKAAWAVQELLLSEILISGTILTLLAQYGVLTGLAAAACTPVGAIAFAAGMWGGLARSLVNLKREYSKLHDAAYLFQDKITKFDNILEKISKLDIEKQEAETKFTNQKRKINDDIAQLKAQQKGKSPKEQTKIGLKITLLDRKVQSLAAAHHEELEEINAKISHWQNVQSRLILQLRALKQVKFNGKLPDQLEEKLNQIDPHPSDLADLELNKKIVAQLEKNQKEKVTKQVVSALGWWGAAIGMTLVAISPFTGPLAPAFLIAGVAIAAVGGAIKLGEAIGARITDAVARKYRYATEQAKLLDEYHVKINSDIFNTDYFKDFSEVEKLKYYLSYEYSHGYNQKISEEAWYASLQSETRTSKERKTIVDGALEKKIKEAILIQTFDVEKPEQLEAVKAQISAKGLDSIIHRECRASLKEYLKEGLVSLFSRKKGKPPKLMPEDAIIEHPPSH